MIDTANNAETTEKQRRLRGGVLEDIKKCTTVTAYNKGMGGVDSRDASLHHYSLARKSFKWFTKLSLHLIHVMLKNSWIVYKSCGGQLDFLNYQEKAIEFLVLESGQGRRNASSGRRLPERNPWSNSTLQKECRHVQTCHTQQKDVVSAAEAGCEKKQSSFVLCFTDIFNLTKHMSVIKTPQSPHHHHYLRTVP